jgi:hypothetical protein
MIPDLSDEKKKKSQFFFPSHYGRCFVKMFLKLKCFKKEKKKEKRKKRKEK